MRTHHRLRALLIVLGVVVPVALLAGGCGSDSATSEPTAASEPAESDPAPAGEPPPRPVGEAGAITLVTHDSFTVSDGIIESFEERTGIDVTVLRLGFDAGLLLSQLIITKDNPLGDVAFGIDNTFIHRALDEGIFIPYRSPELDNVPLDLRLNDVQNRVTPIDYGDVCVNYWIDALDGPPPETLEDLTDPRFADTFVTQNPETSSPGLAFLLATIAAFGEDGWEEYWAGLRDAGVGVTLGWTEAYFGDFIAGGGDRALVTSYATSPVAEVLYADPPTDTPPTGVLTDGCFRQVEFAGILAGTANPEGAQAFVDFMLSDEFQEDIPLNMFVFPVTRTAQVPELFADHAVTVAEPLTLDPALIAEERDNWTARWAEIVLR